MVKARVELTEAGASVVVPPRLVAATAVGVARLVDRALFRGDPIDPALAELVRSLAEAERMNRRGERSRTRDPVDRLPRILDVKGAACALGVDPSRVRKLARAGRLPGSLRLGRDWSIPPDAVEHYRTERAHGRRSG